MYKKKTKTPNTPNKEDNGPFQTLPMIPVRDLVSCPRLVSPILVGRPSSIRSLEMAQEKDKLIFIATQRQEQTEDPRQKDLFPVGTVARIVQILRQDEAVSILVEGVECGRIVRLIREPFHQAVVEPLSPAEDMTATEVTGMRRAAFQLFSDYVSRNPRLSDELLRTVSGESDDKNFFYLIVGNLFIRNEEKIGLLECGSLREGFKAACGIMSREIELLKVEHKILGEVRHHIDEQQKSYFLNEQIKAIEKELGRKPYSEADDYTGLLEKTKLPKHVRAAVDKELAKLDHMAPFSPESTVVRNYLDWVFDIPWNKYTEDKKDIREARAVLDRTHHGLKEPKERVMEFLAVKILREREGGKDEGDGSTVLCLTGPPGVGKTTLAKSVAEALGRKFVRISLGGVSDEAEIRGHRRTYIGSMPGRIVQALKKAGTMNPVILLDEIDKMTQSYHGDPTAALLEVLDPEQNVAFNDHFLEIDLDLSKIIFICTANIEDAIHPTLKDRMEKIALTSYTEREKLAIARNYLLEKQRKANGLEKIPEISDAAILSIIRDYTCESGVRQLDRLLASVMRKLVLEMVSGGGETPAKLDEARIRKFLGTPKEFPDLELPSPVPGVAVGLAWTEVGGAILKIEALTVKGKGELILTGQLGDVMQESARAALTYVRKKLSSLFKDEKFFVQNDIHIHVPEGAIPKDGPSAGITLACALYSVITGVPLKEKLAMTGEITLAGTVLPIGGVKEKLLAAHRAGVREIIMPRRSEAELDDVPPEVLADLKINKVESMDEVIAIAFPGDPAKKLGKSRAAAASKKETKTKAKTKKTVKK